MTNTHKLTQRAKPIEKTVFEGHIKVFTDGGNVDFFGGILKSRFSDFWRAWIDTNLKFHRSKVMCLTNDLETCQIIQFFTVRFFRNEKKHDPKTDYQAHSESDNSTVGKNSDVQHWNWQLKKR